MCHSIAAVRALQQAIPNHCIAKTLEPSQRIDLGVQALARHQTITDLAQEAHVSRKFVYQQAAKAQAALDEEFTSTQDDDQVLFYLPVTKAWLRQVVLALTLICHSSVRGVIEFLRDLLDVDISLGTIHNIHQDAIAKARPYNDTQNLANVQIAALDEIFQNGQPVLVGADARSTYCFLLSGESRRDADTWGVRLLELKERGFEPQATIADFATGLRAGQRQALPATPCRGDVFHVLRETTPHVTFLENRAFDAMAAHAKLQHKKTKMHAQARRKDADKLQTLTHQAASAALEEAKAIALADDIALLTRWLRQDVFVVSGLAYADRVALYDFVVAEFQARESFCPHRLGPVCTLLRHQRDNLLAFAQQLDLDLDTLAQQFQVSLDTVRAVLNLQSMDPRQPQRWQRDQQLRHQLGERFWPLSQAVKQLADAVVRASSVVENINSRLRNYFFLRRQLGKDNLTLLQFFLNHRRFLRSEHPERKDKSPAELLTGQAHPHWLEMLGYRRFSR